MIYTDSGDSLVIQQFREFYTEVIRLKKVTGQSSLQRVSDDISSSTFLEDSSANSIWQKLMALLEQQMRVAFQFGGDYLLAYEEARYVMVALADEIFLHSNWDGRYAWGFNLLESQLYQTHVAGEVFFKRVDQLMVARDAARIELAKIYLMALSLGFQGKYRGADLSGDLVRYRHRLYDYVYQGRHFLQDDSKKLFPKANEHLLDASEMKLLPPVQRWLAWFGVVLLVALGVQQIVWRYFLTPDLRQVVEKILISNVE